MINTTLAQGSVPVNPLLEAAIAYALAGIKVLPLNPDHPAERCEEKTCIGQACPKCKGSGCRCSAKAPLGKLVPSGYLDATCDEATIRRWWQEHPKANLGVPCRPNGFLVVDPDTKPGKPDGVVNFGKLVGDNDLPAGPCQKTPGGTRGGLHFPFKHPADTDACGEIRILDESTGALEEIGVDIKSNGYVVVSPSTVHGKAYFWVADEGKASAKTLLNTQLPEVPDWLRSYVIKPKHSTKSISQTQAPRPLSDRDREAVFQALEVLPVKGFADNYSQWISIGMAMKFSGLSCADWDKWSAKSEKYEAGVCEEKWKTFKKQSGTVVTIGTIFHYAKPHGFRFPSGHFSLSDVGNAARLALNYGHLMRWYKAEKTWLVWDGSRWKADNKEQPIAFAKEMAQSMYTEAVNDGREDERKFAASSHTRAKIQAMLELAKPDLAVTADMLDTDKFLLNCNNGTIDLHSGQLLPHRQEDFITRLVALDYDPDADAPRFKQFLREIFAHVDADGIIKVPDARSMANAPDGSTEKLAADLIDYVQRALGYSCTGTVKEHKLFIAEGSARNGKSLLFSLVREALGDYAITTDPALLLSKNDDKGHSEGTYELRGIRFALTSETPEGAKLNETTCKNLTGGDWIKARTTHGHFAEFPPTHKLWMATNFLPEIKSQGVAIWDRTERIPFRVRFASADSAEVISGKALPLDKDLHAKLREELPGILAWLVQGCLDWQKKGLGRPAQVKEATDEYKESEDVLAEFIESECILDATAQVKCSDLRRAYVWFCQQRHEVPMNKNAFPARLKEKGLAKKQSTGNTCSLWIGIRLRDRLDGTESKDNSDDVSPDNNGAHSADRSAFDWSKA